MVEPSFEMPPAAENAPVASHSSTAASSQARFTLASGIPDHGDLELLSYFNDLSPPERDSLAEIVRVTMHLTNGPARYKWPHSKDVLDEFVSELNKAAKVRHIIAVAQPSNTANNSSLDPAPAAVDSTSTPTITVPMPPFRQPQPLSPLDYSVMVPC